MSAPFGQCTWYIQLRRSDGRDPLSRDLSHFGDAWEYPTSARLHGYPLGTHPAAGATVLFAPGTQGAGGGGHVAHVEAVYPADWFLVSEMNFSWNGGGWGQVDYRFAHIGAGVLFIY